VNITQLEAFLWVAELKSYTQAAKQLHMSQPAVSIQIRSLEKDLGVKLFQRKERGVDLTEAGFFLHGQARQMLGHYYKIKTGLDEIKGLKTGHLVIGASTIPGEYLLPLLIKEFRREYPGIRITLRIAGSSEVKKWILGREIDLGFTGVLINGKEIECLPWIDDWLVLIVPPGHPWGLKKTVIIEELIREPMLLREPGSGTRQTFEDKLAGQNIPLHKFNVIMELGSTRSIITAVQAGLGVGVVSSLAAKEPVLSGSVKEVSIESIELKRKLYLSRNLGWIRKYASDKFLDFTLSAGDINI